MENNNKTKLFFYPLRKWNIFEQLLFWLNITVATSFLIYGCVHPESISPNLKKAYILNVVSYIANLSNILSILISTQKKISRFWFGGVAAITLGVVSFLNHVTGSWILYWIIQFPLQFVGYYAWRKSSENKKTIVPTSIKAKIWIPWAIIMILLIALWSWIDSIESFQVKWYGSVLIKSWIVYICDASIFIIGLSGALMMLFRYKEEWILWIILDVLLIILWSQPGMLNPQIIIMSSTALLNGIYGIYVWYKK